MTTPSPTFRAEICAALGLPITAPFADIHAATQRIGDARRASGAALPPGVVAVDASALEVLRASARRGEQIAAAEKQNAIVATVEAAVHDGRIPPAARKGWLASLQTDPGGASAAHLARLAKCAVPYAEIGYLGDGQPPTDDDDTDVEVKRVRNQTAYKGWEL